jgi:ubiquitin carboxyl-terminal hydrolase 4/11/15
MAQPANQGDPDTPNPNHRPASPAKRSASAMEGSELAQDDAPPPYDASPQQNGTPSVEEQIAHIQALLNLPLEDGSTWFVVAAKWFNRVMARAPGADQKNYDADMVQGEVGKIDNSSVVAPGKCTQTHTVITSGHG